jgi:fumarate hydratase subunit alpha
MMNYNEIQEKVCDALVRAGSTFLEDKKMAYKKAIANEKNEKAKWVLEQILANAEIAEKNRSPLCDDTGIPHLFLEVGTNKSISGKMLDAIYAGVRMGLETLPGRPMAIKGNDYERIDQSGGLDENPSAVLPAPIIIKKIDEDILRLNILMFGGGPAIRGKTYRVFHKHNLEVVKNEIIQWGTEAVAQLGCSPCTLAVGIGRSHYEAASLMVEAQVYGRFDSQSDFERDITEKINKSDIGALGLHGNTSVLATFVKIGPQRASGVRIVCMRPCCCIEPRLATVEL